MWCTPLTVLPGGGGENVDARVAGQRDGGDGLAAVSGIADRYRLTWWLVGRVDPAGSLQYGAAVTRESPGTAASLYQPEREANWLPVPDRSMTCPAVVTSSSWPTATPGQVKL
jgi:hypothetical protein